MERIKKKRGMQSVDIEAFVELYWDCPYCGHLNTDEGASPPAEWVEGGITPCDNCGKKVRVRSVDYP